MREIDKYFAEQCGVTVHVDGYSHVESHWIDGKELGFLWTLTDPRCLIIVCKKFGIDIIAGDTDKAINKLRELEEVNDE